MTDLNDFGELYHNYRLFGVSSRQLPGMFEPNQRCKEPIISGYIQLAIDQCRQSQRDAVTFTELFCADGYYAMLARHMGADESYGIDNDRDGYFANAADIAARLGLSNVHFIREDVNHIDRLTPTDIVANVGGLYHVPNPLEILTKSHAMAQRFLIVQTVYSLATESPEYFEAPAPGLKHGCRFSIEWLERAIAGLGYDVVDRHRNELEGNARLDDRGSAYYLIRK